MTAWEKFKILIGIVPPITVPPVDRSAQQLTDGGPVTPDHCEIDLLTGMQKGYVVLTAEERAKGFVRPVRRTYTHKTCRTNTTMGIAIAETYARDPGILQCNILLFLSSAFSVGSIRVGWN